jgi:hypothetical protein
VAAHSKEILDRIMQREKPLGVPGGFESAHLPFPLAGRLMRDLGSIVGVPLHTVSYVAEDGSYGSRVASQFVGNDSPWFGTLVPQESPKESVCGAPIAMRLDQDVDHVAVLIHSTPEVMLLAIDSNEDFIQIPVIAQSTLPSLQFPDIVRTELMTPLPDRLIGHDNSPLGQEILYVSEAQREAMVRPDRIADDLGRETIAGITRSIDLHGISLSVPCRS